MPVRRRTREPVDDLLADIYAAALDPARWSTVVARATEFIGADTAMLFLMHQSAREVAVLVPHRLDPALVDRWQENYLDHDLWSDALHGLEARVGPFVATGASVVDPSELRASCIYNELIVPWGMTDLLSTWLAREAGVMSALSFYSAELFQRPHIERLDCLAPHLRLSVRLQRQLYDLRSRASEAEAVLDSLTVGVMTLDAEGRLTRANQRAETILSTRDGLSVRDRRLRCVHSEENEQLDAAIRQAADAGLRRAKATGRALAISRRSRRRPIGLMVAPVYPPDGVAQPMLGADLRRGATVLVTVSDPDEVVSLKPEHLARLFGLTPTESRLAAALASQQSLEDYAAQSAITIGTARWPLKRIMEKTGSRRQSELVRLLVTSVAALTDRSPI